MEFIDSFLLGLIQGLTEFLPISSSGHLVLGRAFLSSGLQKGITFEVVVHFGTLCSILLYYREELTGIVKSLIGLAGSPGEFNNRLERDPNIKLSGYILLSMIPAMIVGFTMKDYIEDVFLNPFMVSIMLLVTGSLLFATKFRENFTKRIQAGNSFAIGLAQAFAILPGISRSGSTISLGLYLGVKREEVANFSFLMVIPVIAGAMVMQLKEMAEVGIQFNAAMDLVIGFLAAFISGYFALKYLIVMLKTKGIHPFAWYCWTVGILGLIYFW
ncbi:undecaprenyl-diphosphate phosphatase [Aliifodinibius sp. S!AR15-10]|uniref:undecaprenyl-diphosphate phosphatase n=1 Tax=Aliifodinibius sp. S!AR15-10 TaxID=2950437 RepID=UPI002859B958|nr:undecaprenyl-diphosphate phosphatase [Aliifodinibius sp. S!AR15-10]MDR8390575.1 undecaprenyl-diphosphate phosphatase [Aliifodinibius sp. S!AR15-10]